MANIQVRRYLDGRVAYRVRVRQHGLGISRQFPTEAEAQAFAEATEENFKDRAPAELSLSKLIDLYLPNAPETGRERIAYWRDKIGHMRAGEVTPAIIRAHREDVHSCMAIMH